VEEVVVEQVVVMEDRVDQELLLLNKHVDLQLIMLLQESGQLMTHIITRKADNGLQVHHSV
jgi:hypothetical protein